MSSNSLTFDARTPSSLVGYRLYKLFSNEQAKISAKLILFAVNKKR